MMTQCPNCQKEIPVSSRHWGKWGCDSCRPSKWFHAAIPAFFVVVILVGIYHELWRRFDDQKRIEHELQSTRQEIQLLRQEFQQLKGELQKR